jgi:hypothetical protein
MIKTEKYFRGVVGVLSLARTVNQEIGPYQKHFINENLGFTVKLSNGIITMSEEDAKDYEELPNRLTSDRIASVAKTFSKISKTK